MSTPTDLTQLRLECENSPLGLTRARQLELFAVLESVLERQAWALAQLLELNTALAVIAPLLPLLEKEK